MSESDYNVVNGYITTPGKFEGEPSWILKLWSMIQNGNSDESLHDGTTAYDAFLLDEELMGITGLEAPDHYIVVWCDDQGFVNHMVMSEEEIDNLEPNWEGEPDLIDSDFDGVTQEYYPVAIERFEDHPDYDSGY